MVVQADKQQHLYTSLSLSPSTTTTQLPVGSHNGKPTTTTTTTTTTSTKPATAAIDHADANPSSRRRQHDPVSAMSRITMSVNQSKPSSSSSSSSSRRGGNVDNCKYGVETNDLSALERVSHVRQCYTLHVVVTCSSSSSSSSSSNI